MLVVAGYNSGATLYSGKFGQRVSWTAQLITRNWLLESNMKGTGIAGPDTAVIGRSVTIQDPQTHAKKLPWTPHTHSLRRYPKGTYLSLIHI